MKKDYILSVYNSSKSKTKKSGTLYYDMYVFKFIHVLFTGIKNIPSHNDNAFFYIKHIKQKFLISLKHLLLVQF